jgi:predicted porin
MRVQNHAGKDQLGNSKDSQLSANSGGLSAPHLGFKGEENLGGGNKTFFKLETGFDMNTGDNNSSSDTSIHGKKSDNKSLFGRQAYLGISNQSLGQLTLGRQNTVGYDAIKDFDPTNNLNQKGLIHYLSGYRDFKNNHNRSDSTIKYQHQLNRVTFLASYQSGNQVGSVKHGSSMAVGLKYRDANWSVGGSFTEIDVAKSAGTASKSSQSLGSTKIINFGGEYRFNRWTFKTGMSHSKLPAIQRGSILQTSLHPMYL